MIIGWTSVDGMANGSEGGHIPGPYPLYRIETEGVVTTANSTRRRQPKGSVCRSSRPVVSI